jgi:hypothetical protein
VAVGYSGSESVDYGTGILVRGGSINIDDVAVVVKYDLSMLTWDDGGSSGAGLIALGVVAVLAAVIVALAAFMLLKKNKGKRPSH